MLEEIHNARKGHDCASCNRRIRPGDPYTQRSLAPGEKPNLSTDWEIRRYCSACVPLPEGTHADAPCTFQVGNSRCGLTSGHNGDHDLEMELFDL